METLKHLSFILLLSIITFAASAQDAVVIDTGNFIRGTIQGTDYQVVSLKKDDGSIQQFQAKDIKEFLWNGVTFVSRPFVANKRTDYRFFKLVEAGSVNLYAMGGSTVVEKKRRKLRFSPSFGVGIGVGSGGYSGVGLGGGISFGGGGGRRDDADDQQRTDRRALYYIEKPGAGEMLEITPDNETSEANTQYIKDALLEKLSDDNDLAERIKNMDTFNVKTIQSLVKTYNLAHQ